MKAKNSNKEVCKTIGTDLLAQFRVALGEKADARLNAVIGNNGYTIGQKFTFTGDFSIEESIIDGIKRPYVVAHTEEGATISLRSLMNISSTSGYVINDTIEVDGRSYTSEFDTDDWENVTQPSTRIFGKYIENCQELTGKTATYLGNVVRAMTRRSDGAQFVSNVRLWNIE